MFSQGPPVAESPKKPKKRIKWDLTSTVDPPPSLYIMNYQGNHYHSSVREVLDSLYSNVDQEAEEAAAEAGAVEGSLPVKLTFVTVVETLIRMINTLSLGNKKVGDQYENKQIFLATFFL